MSFFSKLLSFFSRSGSFVSPSNNSAGNMVPLADAAAVLHSALSARRRARAGAEENFVFSPFSILMVFAMALKGASGPTLLEMQRFLSLKHLPPVPKLSSEGHRGDAPVLELVNRIYVHDDIATNQFFLDYAKTLKEEGEKTEAKAISFEEPQIAADEINSFVAQQTRDHIKDLVTPNDVGPLTRLVLVSAMYFKAAWASPFNEYETQKGTFHGLKDGKPVDQEADIMHVTLKNSPHIMLVNNRVKAIAIPYNDDNTFMYIVQPSDFKELDTLFDSKSKEEGKLYMEDLVVQMNSDEQTAQSWGTHVQLSLPKFKLNSNTNREDLIPIFRDDLGMKTVFDSQEADFSKITGGRDLFVSSFVHAADVAVDEKGTVATSATAMGMMLRMAMRPSPTVSLDIDGPFAFQIRYSPPVDGQTMAGGPNDYIFYSGQIVSIADAH
ncbi:serine protease [Cystoisospora suis]|uniref:Serine protease n=1 Tax=Cystoisospora suis TaxID=483139 RepID=A0A2C6KSZ0_9APIC|nr:serine protease [Cystoisospora suis]